MFDDFFFILRVSTACLTSLLCFRLQDFLVISCASLVNVKSLLIVREKIKKNYCWKYLNQSKNRKTVGSLPTQHPSSDQKAQSLLRGTPLTRPPSALSNSDLSDSVGIDRSGWEGMLLYKVFSGRRMRVTVGKKDSGHATRERRALSWQCGPNLNDKVCTSALKPARAGWRGGGWRGSWGGREERGRERARGMRRDRGGGGKARLSFLQNCWP